MFLVVHVAQTIEQGPPPPSPKTNDQNYNNTGGNHKPMTTH